MARLKNLAGLAVVVLGVAAVLSLLPLGTALQFSPDEGFEVMKGFLCSKGYRLYQDIWNDQPPVHTMILAGAFKLWGPSILTARLVAAGFGVMLLAAFHQAVRERCSAGCALVGTFLLAGSPCVFPLCASVMLEVPAIGTALVSAWLALRWTRDRHWAWLAASGAVMGVALQIKLTAVVVAPAVLAEIVLAGWREGGGAAEASSAARNRVRALPCAEQWRNRAVEALCWGASVALVLAVIGLTWAKGSMVSSLRSHFDEKAVAGMAGPGDFPFDSSLLLMHIDCLVAAAVGLLWAAASKRWREVTFPGILLITVSLIHSVHRPWWNYYYLHIAVPVAWLAAWAVVEGVKTAYQAFTMPRFKLGSARGWQAIVLCGLAAAALSRSETRLAAYMKDLRQSPRVEADALLATMRRYTPRTHWVYAHEVIYPFHAGLLVPPELAVVPAKRFWSGQISQEEIVAACKRYHPEQILLATGQMNAEWRSFLDANYTSTGAQSNLLLFVANDMLPHVAAP